MRSQIRAGLWVTDLAKVAYKARPKHQKKIQFCNPAVRGDEPQTGREFAFPCRVNPTSQKWERQQETADSPFVCLWRASMKGGEKKKQLRKKLTDECLHSCTVYFSGVYRLLITALCLNKKAAGAGTPTLSFPSTQANRLALKRSHILHAGQISLTLRL